MFLKNHRSIITKLASPGKFFHDCLPLAEVVSMDIFNTVLFRRVSPEMVIKKSSQRFASIFTPHASDITWLSVYEYRRVISERLKSLANYHGHDPDCRFAQIVDELLHRFAPGFDDVAQLRQRLFKAELEEELATLIPSPGIISFLNKLQDANKTVVFLSDMYLSRDDVFSLLESFSLHKYFKTGFTSGDQLSTKQSGRLYKFLLKDLRVPPNKVIHVGDHLIADYQTPKRLGIRAFLFLNLKQKFRIHRQRYFLPYTYRHLPVSHSLSRNKKVRGEILQNLNTIHFNTAKFVIAPILLTFVENILRVAKSESVEKVYFVARDGFIFYKYFKKLCANWGFEHLINRAEYIFLSRVTLWLASTRDIWQDGLEQDGWKLRLGGLAAYFRGFGFSRTVIDYFCRKHRLDPYKKRSAKDILSGRVLSLIRDPEFIRFIHEERRRQKELLESYLTQIGFFGASKVLFVDIGWHGTICDRLHRLFGHRKDCPSFRFEYLGFIGRTCKSGNEYTNGNTLDIQNGFYFHSGRGPSDPLTNMCSGAVIRILENWCRTFHGSVIGYKSRMSAHKNQIVPILGPSLRQMSGSDICQIEYFRCLIAGLKEGFVEWGPANWEQDITGFEQRFALAQDVLMKAISSPSLEEAAAFLSIPYQQDGGVAALQTLQGFSFKMLSAGNRSVWIPGNLAWYGLTILNSIYLRTWQVYKMLMSLGR